MKDEIGARRCHSGDFQQALDPLLDQPRGTIEGKMEQWTSRGEFTDQLKIWNRHDSIDDGQVRGIEGDQNFGTRNMESTLEIETGRSPTSR